MSFVPDIFARPSFIVDIQSLSILGQFQSCGNFAPFMSVDRSDTLVLVTGASGYLASHCVQQLLNLGYSVRGTVRDVRNSAKIDPLRRLNGSENLLELVQADLLNENDWTRVTNNCHFILHIASPWPIVADESVIRVAIQGTLNVLRAATDCQTVRKVIITGSCSAINDGHGGNRTFDETCWTDVNSSNVENYARSKTLAEQAAWRFWREESPTFALTVLNPTLIVGPLLTNDQGGSVTIVKRFLDRSMPLLPRLNLGTVDVRDCARAHILMLNCPESDGHRILITTQPSLWFSDIAVILRDEFGPKGYSIPTYTSPHLLVKLFSLFDTQAKSILHRLNFELKGILKDFEYLSPKKSLVDMVYSMIDRGILPKPYTFGYESQEEELNNQKILRI